MRLRLARSAGPFLLASLFLTTCLPHFRRPPQVTPTQGTPLPVRTLRDLSDLFPSNPTSYTAPYPFSIRSEGIATLNVPSGEVIVSDLFFGTLTGPLTRRVQPGDYPVSLSLISEEGQPWESVGAAKLQFSSNPPVSWELALLPGQDPNILMPGEFFYYPVDSGTASFSSPMASDALSARLDADPGYLDEMTGSWGSIVPDPSSSLNVVFFSSGYGDGRYASYWGLDVVGDPVCLVTDFRLVDIEHLPRQ